MCHPFDQRVYEVLTSAWLITSRHACQKAKEDVGQISGASPLSECRFSSCDCPPLVEKVLCRVILAGNPKLQYVQPLLWTLSFHCSSRLQHVRIHSLHVCGESSIRQCRLSVMLQLPLQAGWQCCVALGDACTCRPGPAVQLWIRVVHASWESTP